MQSLFLVALALTVSQTPQVQAAAITAAKNAIARDVDNTLPPVKLEAWLRELVGTQAVLKWSVTDCGEQTGNPALDRGRDFPMCVEVNVNLPGNRLLSLSLLTGSMARGLAGGPLRLYSGAIIEPAPKPITWIKALAEVPKLIGQPISHWVRASRRIAAHLTTFDTNPVPRRAFGGGPIPLSTRTHPRSRARSAPNACSSAPWP